MKRLTTALFSGLLLAPVVVALAPSRAAAPPQRLPPIGTRGPCALQFSPDGKLLYVVEQDENRVTVLDPDTGKTLAHIPSGGKGAGGLAISADGTLAVVANQQSGTVGLLDLGKRELKGMVALPGGPRAVALAADGTAFVSLEQLDAIGVVDTAAAKAGEPISLMTRPVPGAAPWTLTNTPASRRPGALALTPDGRTLLCATLSGSGVSLIDVASRKETACLRVPAVNLRGITVAPDGRTAYVTAQSPTPSFTTGKPEETWSNAVWSVRLDGERSRCDQMISLDTPAAGAADPTAVVTDRSGRNLLVTLAGAHELAVVRRESGQLGPRIPVGLNPRAVAVRPGSGEVWVANHLGNSLSVLSGDSAAVSRTVALDPASRPDIRLRGRFLFTSGHLARGGRFTCNSCHPEGGTDGLAWKFSHLQDGVDRRNSRNLRGGVLLTAPYRWSGKEQDFEDFVNDEVAGFFGRDKLTHAELHAFWDLVNDFPLPPNPYRSATGAFTAQALRGQALFNGKAGCASCHAGPLFGGTGKQEWVGTTPEGSKLDVPHLLGAFDSAPYLHDARAESLEAIFKTHNEKQRHGKAHLLTPEELGDVLEFVREL